MHFAPTEVSAKNLRDEGKKEENIYITGNTAIDAMATTVDENYENPIFDWIGDDRMILLTAHRRENLGEPMYHIFRAIKRICRCESCISDPYESEGTSDCKRSF